MKLNLGCGQDYRKGFVNADIRENSKKDITINMEEGLWKFKDNTFNYIYLRHVLEHIDPKKLTFLMEEMFRICKSNATIDIYVPHFSCGKTYQTHEHLTFMSYFTFQAFPKFTIVERKLSFMRVELEYENPTLNKIAKVVNPFASFLPNMFPFIYERLFCWVYPMEEIHIKLEVKK